jgi:hypothetical protein
MVHVRLARATPSCEREKRRGSVFGSLDRVWQMMTYQSEQDGQQRESSSDRVEDHGVGKVLENVGTLSVTAHQKEGISFSDSLSRKKKQTRRLKDDSRSTDGAQTGHVTQPRAGTRCSLDTVTPDSEPDFLLDGSPQEVDVVPYGG